MAEQSLDDALYEQAGVLLLAAQAVQTFTGSRKRTESSFDAARVSRLCGSVRDIHLAFMQYLYLEQDYPTEAGGYALFYTASAIRHLLYELEHELLSHTDAPLWADDIERVRNLRALWTTDPVNDMKRGILDAWNVEQGLQLARRIAERFS